MGEIALKEKSNLICNFKAPDKKHFSIWLEFKEEVKDSGLDICYVALSLFQAWLKAVKSVETATFRIGSPITIINLQQENHFEYIVAKPRRLPLPSFCTSKRMSGTLRSRALQAYICEKARELNRSFSFFDFPELGHSLFRKLVLELRKRGKILPLEPRTNPRLYALSDQIFDYPSMQENITVKPKFTEGS